MKDRKRKQSKSGFTLVELLVVLVILMVIGTIAVQNFSGQEDKAKVKAVRASFTTLENALERFKLDMGRYPTEDEGLSVLITAPEDDDGSWGPKYLKKERHLQDAWGNDYLYTAPGPDSEPFEIVSYGADGSEGGEGQFDADLSNLD
ncbi:type II secretion system major pseudopilin GspG [Pontiella sp.]|uniref:type II secretion system major pseudopilin GspG n=1 Tax=Pontiella sp. TaxID=2837462 RepID=UPI003567AB2B